MSTGVMDKELVKLVDKHGVMEASRKLMMAESTLRGKYKRAKQVQFKERRIAKPIVVKAKEGARKFLLSSAQDKTKVFTPFLKNMEAYAQHIGAEILISGYTYSKSLFVDEHSKESVWYAPEIVPYLTLDRYEIGKNISFCGEMNILPTAVNPLSGLETYTRDKWGIFPHAKVQLKSIPTMKNDITKMIMTTGTITKPNYIPKKDGIKAHFHHVYAFVLVEVDTDGTFFCRHVLADSKDGSFYDINNFVSDEKVTDSPGVLGLTWGDIHLEKLDEDCFRATLDLVDVLKPEVQFVHDLIDFKARNHHNIGDPHFMFKMSLDEDNNRLEALPLRCYDFLKEIERDFSKTVVVESNHDKALLRWLKHGDYKSDPLNAIFFLKAQTKVYESIKENKSRYSVLEELIRDCGLLPKVKFLLEDESYKLADIECGMHGHLGANGSKGSSVAFSRMGPKANVGHTHSAQIFDGIYTAGVSGLLDMEYNKGLSSWSHTHIVTYKNGKRALLTYNNGRFFLE